MSWYVCYFAALAVIALGVLLWLSKKTKPLHILIAVVFGVAFSLGFAPYYVMSGGFTAEAIVNTFTRSLRIFASEADYSALDWTVHMAPAWMQSSYTYLLLAVQVVAPFLTLGFLLSMFKNISGYFRLRFSKSRDVFAFSQLNEKSLTLAEDLRRNHPKAMLVFADVYDAEDEAMAELAHRAKGFGCVCFKHSVTAICFRKHSPNANISFFAISEDASQNIRQGMKLIEQYNHRPNTHLYLFSTGTEGELLLSGMNRGEMKVRRIHEEQSLVFRLLYEQGDSLFDTALPLPDGQRQITAVIVGLDGRGREMLKALSWFGQMDGYRLTIHAFDPDPQAQAMFTAQCPELMSMSGKQIPGEAQYDIHIHGDCPVDSLQFVQKIESIGNATWVFVSAGSDEVNIHTAAMLRTSFRRSGCNPQIRVVIEDSGICPALAAAANHAGQSYEILPLGDVKSSYTEAVILQSDAEADAFRRHKAYCNGDLDREEDFWRLEYCYRSSMASAIHATARKKCLSYSQMPEEALSAQQRQGLEHLEHRRWNAYMRAEGYIYSGSTDPASRDDLGKMHHNLVPFTQLSHGDQHKDSRVAAENR